MVVCRVCNNKERLVTRNVSMQPMFKSLEQARLADGDLMNDPSMMTLVLRCSICKTEYSFSRVISTDELRKEKADSSKGCGGCGG